jgi:hypothetical protein
MPAASAVVVHEPEVGLRGADSLVGCEPKPPHRLGTVLRHAFAVGVTEPEVVLRASITCLSTHPQRIDLRRLRLHRRTDERDQDGDDGYEPDGVRHKDVSGRSITARLPRIGRT